MLTAYMFRGYWPFFITSSVFLTIKIQRVSSPPAKGPLPRIIAYSVRGHPSARGTVPDGQSWRIRDEASGQHDGSRRKGPIYSSL